MRKLLVLAALLVVAWASSAQAQVIRDTAVATPPRQITYFGSGGVTVYPDGTTWYCPNPGQTVCAISNGNYPTDTITIFGSGGVTVYPDGRTVYCPNAGTTVCAITNRKNPTGGIVTIYGSGGTVVYPDGTVWYCPIDGTTVCAIVPSRGYVPSDTVTVGGNRANRTNPVPEVKIFDTKGNEIQLHDGRYALPTAPDVKQSKPETPATTGAKLD